MRSPDTDAAVQRWLLVYNCVHIGLGNCLSLLAPELQVDALDLAGFQRDIEHYGPKIAEYDLVIVGSPFLAEGQLDLKQARRVRALPFVNFDAYHPDMSHFLDGNGKLMDGPMGGYLSKIIVAAYMQGLPRSQVAALFDGRRYQQFGYFDVWEPARETLLREFAAAGCDLREFFPSWSAPGAFMHAGFHPAMRMIHDLAIVLLESERVAWRHSPALPPDNMLSGPVFPVYEEIAEHLSIPGSYLFKLPNCYRFLDLEQFINASWTMLEQQSPASVRPDDRHVESYRQVVASL